MLRLSKGFTLIELMVTIGIIAVLASIAIVSMNNARKKANDAIVISQLSMARDSAQIYYDANKWSYANSNGGGVANNCNAPHSMFLDSASGMYQYASSENYPDGTELRCTSKDAEYEMTASLSAPGEYWCVNHQGASKKINAASHIKAHPNNDTDCNP